ncbi:permuted papain-like amidase YaeF/Yiix C92 family enzyme [Oceanotoga teriensis]|uniref:Permuted papain-like amidase YaeF/Yiix C92 family enzyme n=1 Tax=Oceanotoga teriensis TaxID=515440 RepID=A0AA45HK16_9BACT|nr:permuted papain-like amidase YaeF/Yiix C92 family enzyme [Oceanotoga teriensis]
MKKLKKTFLYFITIFLSIILSNWIINKNLFNESSYRIGLLIILISIGFLILYSTFKNLSYHISKFKKTTLKESLKVFITYFLLAFLITGSNLFKEYTIIISIPLLIANITFLSLLMIKLFKIIFKKNFKKNLITISLIFNLSITVFSNTINIQNNNNLFFNLYKNYENMTMESFYALQKYLAISITGVQYIPRNHKFIKKSQVKLITKKLNPGDIIVRRLNWQLTNIGIGSFWTHSGIYLGNLDQMNDYFKNIKQLNGKKFSDYIKQKFPLIYKNLKNNDYSIIEAIAKGVSINKVENMGESDYFAAVRSDLNQEEIFEVVLESFSHYGKEYDYKFDFENSDELVCSELVYLSYKKFINIPFKYSKFRWMLSPNDLIEYALKNKFSVPIFLDGSEKTKIATLKDAKELELSLQRNILDILQK